jgi:hypothetical protein
MPISDMHTMMLQAAITAALPALTSFLKLNSNPSANNRNMTPISDHVCMLAVSMTDGVYEKCGLARKPATIYPSTSGCLSHLKMRVMTPAQIKMSARSLMRGFSSDIVFNDLMQM